MMNPLSEIIFGNDEYLVMRTNDSWNPLLRIMIELDTFIERKKICSEDEEDALDEEIAIWIKRLSQAMNEE